MKNDYSDAEWGAIDQFSEYVTSALYNIYDDLRKRQKKQYVKKIPKGRITKIWNQYADIGLVIDEKGLDIIQEIVLYNIALLWQNTILCGHTSMEPENYLMSELELNKKEVETIFKWLDKTYYSYFYHISDYANEKLQNLAIQLLATDDMGKRIMYIDLILNVYHQSSDLSELFIEGGAETLDCLFNNV